MVEKTQSEIDEQKAKDERDHSNLFGSLWEGIKGIFSNIGTLLMIGIAAFAAIKIFGLDKIKDFFGGLLDKLPGLIGKINADWEEPVRNFIDKIGAGLGMQGKLGEYLLKQNAEDAQKLMVDKKIPASIAAILAKDTGTWKNFVTLAICANGNQLSNADELTGGKTLMQMAQDKNGQAQLKAIFNVLNPGINKKQTDAEAKMWADLMDKAGTLVSGDGLGGAINKNTLPGIFKMLANLAPDSKLNPDQILTQLTALGMLDKDGNPTATLQKGLGNVVAALKDGKISQLTPEALMPYLLDGVDLSKAPGGSKIVVDTYVMPKLAAQLGKDNAFAFRTALGDDKTLAFAQLAATGDRKKLQDFMGAKENLPLFKGFAENVIARNGLSSMHVFRDEVALLHSLPLAPLTAVAEHMNPLTLVEAFAQPGKKLDVGVSVSRMLDPRVRAMVKLAGVENVAPLMAAYMPKYKEVLTEHNLKLILSASDKINPGQTSGKQYDLERSVVAATVDLEINPTAFKKLSAENQIAPFFANKNNSAATADLLKGLEGFDGENKVMIDALNKFWKVDANKGLGLGFVLGTPEGAKLMQDHPPTGSGQSAGMSTTDKAMLWGYSLFSNSAVAQNKDVILDFEKALEVKPPVTPTQGKTNTLASNSPQK